MRWWAELPSSGSPAVFSPVILYLLTLPSPRIMVKNECWESGKEEKQQAG